MKAIRINAWGGPAVVEEVPQPAPSANQVLVRVKAASINPVDTAIMAGYLAFMTSTPLTLGTDFSGVVVEVGPGVIHVKPGDEVYGLIPMGTGTFAEYALPTIDQIALKPRSLDHIHASTIPLPSMAAWQSLFEHGQFKKGQRVLIHGVGGNVGYIAASLAKNEGAYVYGTDIPEKAGHVAALGIDRFIDVKQERFEDVVKDVDLVLDFIGNDYLERSYTVIQPGGRYVTALSMQPDQEGAQKRGIVSTGCGAVARGDLLEKIAALADAGKLKFFVNRTFPMEQTQTALEYRLTTKSPGKVVILTS